MGAYSFACSTSLQAQFDAGELITQRELVSQRIRTALIKRSAEFDIALEDISITHLTFGKEFTQAVEMKQVGMSLPHSWRCRAAFLIAHAHTTEQQKAERARFIVEKAEQEQLAEIIRAEGDSEVRIGDVSRVEAVCARWG